MSTNARLLDAVCGWHASGLITAPRAASVQLTGVLVEQVLAARTLLGEIADGTGLSRRVPRGEFEGRLLQFLADTACLERFRDHMAGRARQETE